MGFLGLLGIIFLWLGVNNWIKKELEDIKKGAMKEEKWVECRTQHVKKTLKRMPPK